MHHCIDSPPEKGEDFGIIADDYQKLILPGKIDRTQTTFGIALSERLRFDPLAASIFLCLFSDSMYV